MLQKSRHSSSKSPIKKQLAKRMINYFDQLDEAKKKERPQDRREALSRSRSRTRSASKRSLGVEENPNAEFYEDIDLRKRKLQELKDLMKRELLKAKQEQATEIDPKMVYKSVHGYPSFMKTESVNETFRRKETHDADMDAFKKSVHKLLEQTVLKADGKDPEEESSVDMEQLLNDTMESQAKFDESRTFRKASSRSRLLSKSPSKSNIYDEQLYSLEVDKTILTSNHVESNAFDFHQRKAKEIRRLQYASGLKDKSPKKIAKAEVLDDEVREPTQAGKPREKRTNPDEGYPVYIRLVSKVPPQDGVADKVIIREIPGVLRHNQGFKINPQTDTMEVIEKDQVQACPYDEAPENEIFEIIKGQVERPEPESYEFENDCELVVETKDGKRYAILFYLRDLPVEPAKPEEEAESGLQNFQLPIPEKPARNMTDANCRVFDIVGQFLGRAHLSLQDQDPQTGERYRYSKGILINDQEKIEFVLVRLPVSEDIPKGDKEAELEDVPSECRLTRKDLQKTYHAIDEVEELTIANLRVQCLTLSERNAERTPELLFILKETFAVQKNQLLHNEFGSCEMEDWRLFQGRLEYEQAPNDREGTLWLVSSQNFPAQQGESETDPHALTFGTVEGKEKVRIELDETDPNKDITNILDRIKLILEARKAEKERLEREERDRLEREIRDRLEREERDRLERENRIRMELEERDQLEREERDRLEREIRDRLEREERERLEREERDRLERENRMRMELEERRRQEELLRQLQKKEQELTNIGPECRDHIQEISVICPGGHKLYIYLQHHDSKASIDRIICEDFHEPENYPESQKMAVVLNNQKHYPESARRLRAGKQAELSSSSRAAVLSNYNIHSVQVLSEETCEVEVYESQRVSAIVGQRETEQGRLEAEAREMAQREQERIEQQERARIQREKEEAEAELLAKRERERIEREEKARIEREKKEAEARALAKREQERIEQEEKARLEKQKKEAEALALAKREQERIEAEEKARVEREKKEAELLAKREQERIEREEKARLEREKKEAEAELLAKREQERIEREEKARLEREKKEAEALLRREKEKREKEEKEKKEREKREAEEKARREKEKKEAEERAKKERERREAEEKARKEREEKLKKEREEKARKDKEKREAEEKARKEREKKAAEEKARKEKEKKEAEEKAKKEREEKLKKEKEEKARKEKEKKEKKEAEELAKREAAKLEEEEKARKQKEKELLRIQKEEEEKKRREIVETQKKVKELKEALSKSKLDNSQEIQIMKKTPGKEIKNERYNVENSYESEAPRTEAAVKPLQYELEKKIETVKVEPQKKVFESVLVEKKSEKSQKKNTLAMSDVQHRKKKVESRKSDILLKSPYSKKSVVSSRHVTTKQVVKQQVIELDQDRSFTKIELNLENSEDDIDFIGYGSMKVTQKKERSVSPILKTSFTKISPARNIGSEIEGKSGSRYAPTRAFTPLSKRQEHRSEVKETVILTGEKTTHHQEVGYHSLNATSAPGRDLYFNSFVYPGEEELSPEGSAAFTIQWNYRFFVFRRRLRDSQEYHNILSQNYSQKELFTKYRSFVASLPYESYSQKTFKMFISTITGFK